jgi:hypothetical protein
MPSTLVGERTPPSISWWRHPKKLGDQLRAVYAFRFFAPAGGLMSYSIAISLMRRSISLRSDSQDELGERIGKRGLAARPPHCRSIRLYACGTTAAVCSKCRQKR